MADQKPKSTTGTIIRHGEAPYQHDPNNSTNYFVEVEVEKDKFETLWGVQLKELVESQQLEVGEKASFHKFKQDTGANRWEAARYFEAEKLENSIERDFEQEKSADQVSEFGQSKVKQSANYGTDDAEYIVPNAIRNRYLSVAVNKHTDSPMVKFYERENPASVAFEDRGDKGLHTSKSDKDTVTAMLDMAQSKGWESIKLKGSEEFKREAWMEAQMRGIKTKGYEPSEKDKLELQARQEERTSNQIEATKIGAVYTKEADKTSLDHSKDVGVSEGQQKTIYEHLQNPQDNQAYLDKIGLDFDGAKAERFAQSFDEARERVGFFVGKELTNEHDGITAVISRRSIDKMLSGKAHEKSVDLKTHLLAVSNVDKLFQNSIFGWKYQDRDNDENINAIHRAVAPFKVDDKVYLAKLTVKELARDGNRVYSLEALEIEHDKSPVPEMTSIDQYKEGFTLHRPNGALIDIIVKNAQDFNKNHQKTLENDSEVDATEFGQSMDAEAELFDAVLYEQYHEDLENGEISTSMEWEDYRDDWREAFAEAEREAEIAAAEQHHDLKEVETEAYVRAEEFQRGRDIDPDLDMNIAGEAERFKSNAVSAPKVAGMTQAKVTQKVEAAFDRKIDGSMAAAKRDDFKKDFEENKAKLPANDKVKVEAVRRVLDFLHKDSPKELQAGYEKLTTAMKNGEISKLPDVPQQVVQQSIEIQAPTQSNKDRGR